MSTILQNSVGISSFLFRLIYQEIYVNFRRITVNPFFEVLTWLSVECMILFDGVDAQKGIKWGATSIRTVIQKHRVEGLEPRLYGKNTIRTML